MRANSIEFQDFRNLKSAKIQCHPSVNVIYGDNAQGKTNLLEAIWLFSGARSFRGAKDSECIAHGSELARLSLEFESLGRNHTAQLDISNKRSATLDGVSLKTAGELAGNFKAVVFSPTHLSLIKDGPSIRRRFIDTAIGQIWPKYIGILKNYTYLLAQRNALLKDVRYSTQLYDMLSVYDSQLAEIGSKLTAYRNRYVDRLNEFVGDIYGGISGGKEILTIEYEATGGCNCESLLNALKISQNSDISTATTSVGPHRDELSVKINGMAARSFGSQGQQRSAVIALKLSEAAVINQITDEQPVALLDDVMSELDEGRQDYILNHIKDWQVFITCCDRNSVKMLKEGTAFRVVNGEVKEEK